MLAEHCLIVYRIAQSFDLVSDVCLSLISFFKSICCIISAFICELNRSGVAVVVDEPPVSLVGLQDLVWKVRQLYFLGRHDELVSLVTRLWLRSQKCEKWDSTDSPLGSIVCELLNTHCLSSESSVEDSGCGVSEGGSKIAIEV